MKPSIPRLLSFTTLVLGLTLAVPPQVQAQDDAALAAAIENYNQGERAFTNKRYNDAVDYLLKSYTHYPHPLTAYFLSSAYVGIKDLANAKKFSGIALEAVPPLPEPDRTRAENNHEWAINEAAQSLVERRVGVELMKKGPDIKSPVSPLAQNPRATKGNLFWYKGSTPGGMGEVRDPQIIGKGGWHTYQAVFANRDGVIYAITHDGNLLWYKDTTNNGVGEVKHPKIIGKGGWQTYKSVFSGDPGVIYAITHDGNLLCYKDTTHAGVGELKNPTVIGKGGWQAYKSVFAGGNRFIYAITHDGNLLSYKDTTHDGAGEVKNARLIGKGGWQAYRNVFSGGAGLIYAITNEGDLLLYKDSTQSGAGEVANAKVVGKGGWQAYRSVFAGAPGTIYAITAE